MFYKVEYQKRAHQEVEKIFRVLFPEQGLAVREEQIRLCHEMLDTLLGEQIALCDAGVGIGKTYAYLVACVLLRKYSMLTGRGNPLEQRPVVVSTSSIALQKAILTEYIPFLSRVLLEQGIIQSPLRAVVRKGKEHFVCDNRLESIPLWIVTLLGSLLITVLSFIMILTVYGRMFKLYMYTAIAPIPISTFAGEPSQSVGKNFIKSYAGVCLEGAIIALACIIFSVYSASPPAIGDTSLSAVTIVWNYVGELVFNLLVLVGAVKASDRIVREMMGL